MSVHVEWAEAGCCNPEVVDQAAAEEYRIAAEEPIAAIALAIGSDSLLMIEADTTNQLREVAARITAACDRWDESHPPAPRSPVEPCQPCETP